MPRHRQPNEDLLSILYKAEQDGEEFLNKVPARELFAAGTTRKQVHELYKKHHEPRRQERRSQFVREDMEKVEDEERGLGGLYNKVKGQR